MPNYQWVSTCLLFAFTASGSASAQSTPSSESQSEAAPKRWISICQPANRRGSVRTLKGEVHPSIFRQLRKADGTPVYKQVAEKCGDLIDNDCDGEVDEPEDCKGGGVPATKRMMVCRRRADGTQDFIGFFPRKRFDKMKEAGQAVFERAPERCEDGVDNNCNGKVDEARCSQLSDPPQDCEDNPLGCEGSGNPQVAVDEFNCEEGDVLDASDNPIPVPDENSHQYQQGIAAGKERVNIYWESGAQDQNRIDDFVAVQTSAMSKTVNLMLGELDPSIPAENAKGCGWIGQSAGVNLAINELLSQVRSCAADGNDLAASAAALFCELSSLDDSPIDLSGTTVGVSTGTCANVYEQACMESFEAAVDEMSRENPSSCELLDNNAFFAMEQFRDIVCRYGQSE